jgi:hypothetical protein
VLLALGLKLEVRVDGHQLVVRWGTPPPVVVPAPEPPALANSGAPAPASARDMQLVKQLIHVLADDVATRDGQNAEAIRWLEARVDSLQRQVLDRWRATERYVSALYTLNANTSRKELDQ